MIGRQGMYLTDDDHVLIIFDRWCSQYCIYCLTTVCQVFLIYIDSFSTGILRAFIYYSVH